MSYDVSVSVPEWPADVATRWVAEVAAMGVTLAFHADFDPQTSNGWAPVKISKIVPTAPIPLARTLAKSKKGAHESGFEYFPSADRAAFSSKSEFGNAAAIWCAAALAAVVGGTVEDPQFNLTASGESGVAIMAKLAENKAFVEAVSGPAPKSKKKAPGAPKALKAAVAADPSKPVRPYSASGAFEVGERIEHPTFGEGVVEVSVAGKITAFFAGARRVLVQSKDGGQSVGETTAGTPSRTAIDHSTRSGQQKV